MINGEIMINSDIEQLLKFHLQCGHSKFPSTEWNKCNHHLWTKDKHKTGHKNYGIPAGKKNGVILLDLDAYKWDDDHPFYELTKKENLEEYLKSLGTITVRTGHDGWHLWFKYNNEINTRDNHELNIDIKSDGGYGVGPGSKMIKQKGKAPDSEVGKFGYYREIFRDTNTNLQPMPKELIDWLNKYQQPSGSKKVKTKKFKTGNPIIDSVSQEGNQYEYNIPENKLKEIVAKLSPTLWSSFSEWFKLTTAFKALNKKEFWDKECKKHPNYDKANNEKIWDSITWAHNGMNLVNWMLNQTDDRTLLDYIKYKPIPENKLKNSQYKYESINRRKLGEIVGEQKDLDYVKLEKYKDVFIKSDTATGKTTLLKKYIFKTHQPVISIVSRVSLADSHYNDFHKQGINIYNYHITDKSHWLYEDGDSVVITIESIKRIAHLDFSEYVIFLDEYDSLIKHLLNSPTLKDKGAVCWAILRRMIKECKQVVAVDADIHSNRMKFLTDLGRDVTIIENKYKHNKGVKMREVFNFDDFLEEVNKVEDKLICCDSKKSAELIFSNIVGMVGALPIKKIEREGFIQYQLYKCSKGKTYALITSDTDQYVDLDDYDIVVFSPKIIYGLDSVRKRPVFGHYKEHTINPRAMLQQVARCRNIVELVYIFYRKQFQEEKYTDLEDVKNEYKKLKEYTIDFKELLSKTESELYEKMLIDLEYEEDCYNTNKFAHFRKGAMDKGFIERMAIFQTESKTLLEAEKEQEEIKEELFNPNDPIHEKFNKYLEFPEDVMIENKKLFLKQAEFTKFINRGQYFFKGNYEWQEELRHSEDFILKKMKTSKSKFSFITKTLLKLGITDKRDLTQTKQISKSEADSLWDEYKTLFRDRSKKKDLTIEYEVQKWLGGIYSSLFGSEILHTNRVTVAGKKITKYTIDEDGLYEHRDLMRYRDNFIPEGQLDFRIGYEFNIARPKLIQKHKKNMRNVLRAIKRI